MSIQDDIEALEKAIEERDKWAPADSAHWQSPAEARLYKATLLLEEALAGIECPDDWTRSLMGRIDAFLREAQT